MNMNKLKDHKYLYIQYSVIFIKIIKNIKTNFIRYDTIILFNK